MRPDFVPLNIPAQNASGTATDVHEYEDFTAQVVGAGSAPISIEGSLDGTNYDLLTPSPVTANGIVVLSIKVILKKIRVTLGAGTVPTAVILAMRSSRTDS